MNVWRMSGPIFRIPLFWTRQHSWSLQGGYDQRPNGNWLVCLQFVRSSR